MKFNPQHIFSEQRARKARFCCFGMKGALLLLLLSTNLMAQFPGGRNLMQNMPRESGGGRQGPFKDSLLHRTGLEDSATILYRYLDTARYHFLDSSVNDFTRRWPIEWTSIFLGNTGTASRSLLFTPITKAGWDHGMHAYNAYTLDESDARFYNTSRPFTELSYVLGARQEQNIGVLHTQNFRYNWNASFRYQLRNAPGIFRNQLTNHNNLLFTTWYTGTRKRYSAYVIAGSNNIQASESGGLRDITLLDSTPAFSDRFNIPANFGGSDFRAQTFFNSEVTTGNKYRNSFFLFRHHYDLGKKDSVQTDSSTTYLFFPRLRFQHTLRVQRYQFRFVDTRVDTASYRRFYGLTTVPDTFSLSDSWRVFDNELAIIQFPDIKNQQQFLKVAAGVQQLQGDFGMRQAVFTNLYVNGEYRNRTRNKKWDMELSAQFFAGGAYAGDYQVHAALRRFIGNKLGYLTLEFQNVNRTPSFVHDDRSNFKVFNTGNTNFLKENTTMLSGQYELPEQNLLLRANYFLLSNFTNFRSFTASDQEATLFNVLQVQAQKVFRVSRRWNWYADVWVQQATGNAPVNLPLVLTRQRFAYEGRFFKNLNLSTGLEMRYHTPYKADGYSPVLGQFFQQNESTIRIRPDIAAFFHVRIRSLYLFIRAENLNTLRFNPDFGFLQNNFVTPLQPLPGLFTRFGIFWGFVN